MRYHTRACAWLRHPYYANLVPTILLWTIAATSETANAARADLAFAKVRTDGGAVVAATLQDVEKVYEHLPAFGDRPIVRAYRFKVHVVEVLYGDGIASSDVIAIDKSFAGYGSAWEATEETAGYGELGDYSKMPPDGTKVIAFFQPPQDGRRDLYGYSSSVLVLNTFDDPRVEMWRRIAQLWSMPPSRELVAKLFQGARSNNLPYQLYCLDVLSVNRADKKPFPEYTGIWLEGATTRGEIDAKLWEIFTDSATQLEAVMPYSQKFVTLAPNAQGAWLMHPVRYDVLAAAIRRRVASRKSIDWQQIGHAIAGLMENPIRAGETRELILSLASTPDSTPASEQFVARSASTLDQLYRLYVPNAVTAESLKLNEQILNDLSTRLKIPFRGKAEFGLWKIAESCAALGIARKDIVELLLAEDKRLRQIDSGQHLFGTEFFPPQIEDTLSRARRAIGGSRLPETLSWPFGTLLGKKVCLLRNGVGSASDVWIEGSWPRTDEKPDYAIVIGTLRKYDVPYFDLVPGKEFGNGIPIPLGYSSESIAFRYSLENPSWILVPRAKVRPARGESSPPGQKIGLAHPFTI